MIDYPTQADLERAKGGRMRKLAILLMPLLLLVLLIGGVGCGGDGTTTPTLLPEAVIPLAVPGFSFVEKNDHFSPIWEGEEYSAYSLFFPRSGSRFDGKVESLYIQVYLFQDEASASEASNVLAGAGTSQSDIQVNGTQATLSYTDDMGEAATVQLQGLFVIVSDSMPPFEWPLPDPEEYDRQVLEDAAIEGLRAVQSMLSSQ